MILKQTGETPGSPDGSRMWTVSYDILADGTRVGTCELRPEVTWATPLSGQIAYTVFPPWRGRGYGTEAVRLLCREARRRGMTGLTATCRPENAASRRTLEKAGARLAGIRRVPPAHPLRRAGCDRLCAYVLPLDAAKNEEEGL